MVEIQIQDISGDWFTVQKTQSMNQSLKRELDQAVKIFRKRVRAIDSNSGQIIDLR